MPKANGQPTRAERSAANKAAFAAKQRAPRGASRSAAPAKVQAPPPLPAGWRIKSPPVLTPREEKEQAQDICWASDRVHDLMLKSPSPEDENYAKVEAFAARLAPPTVLLAKHLRKAGLAYGHATFRPAPCGAHKVYDSAWNWLNAFHDPGEDI